MHTSNVLSRLSLLPLLLAFSFAIADIGPLEHVDALNKVFGKHPGARAVHAKGTVLEGTFVPSSAASSVSKAAHFQQAVAVTIRFSNSAGIPTLPDNHALSNPRGLAIKFKLADGTTTDIVSHSFNGFPAPTGDDFHDLIVAIGDSGTDAAKPTALDNYLSGHPVAKNFLTTQKTSPVSFATLPYYGVNAFKFTNAIGVINYGRYQIIPQAHEQLLSAAEAAQVAPDYLKAEIRQRLENGPLTFKIMLQLAETGDKLHDPSIAWPDSRKLVELGTLSITKAVLSEDADKLLLFQPNAVTAGIEVEDPMVNIRAAAYSVSFGRRQQ